jgi:hypothetical protein
MTDPRERQGPARRFPSGEEKVPLKRWAEARARPGEPMDWGAGWGDTTTSRDL